MSDKERLEAELAAIAEKEALEAAKLANEPVVKTKEELEQELETLKKDYSGISRTVSEYKKNEKLREDDVERQRIANLSKEDKSKELERKVEAFEKKDTWRNLCVVKGLDSNKYEKTALRLDISELETFADELISNAEATKLAATEEAKKNFQENIPSGQPNNSEQKTQEQLTEELLKSKGLL
jgi:hypothetical protein